jgi:hypothetical protein
MGGRVKSMAETALDVIKYIALPFGVAIAFVISAIIFFKGAVWASMHILPPLISIGWIVLAIVLLILLPLSVFRRLRSLTGAGIYLASYLFGLICWLVGLVVAYMLWGLWAVIIGVLFLGIGVVPLGMLAALFKGEWYMLIVLVVLAALTFGARFLGLVFLSGPASLSEADADVGNIGEKVET